MLTDTSKEGIIIIKGDASLKSCFAKMTDIFQNGANIYTELSAALELISVVYEQIKPEKEKTAEHAGKRIADKVRKFIELNDT